jgi:hypothetical protein
MSLLNVRTLSEAIYVTLRVIILIILPTRFILIVPTYRMTANCLPFYVNVRRCTLCMRTIVRLFFSGRGPLCCNAFLNLIKRQTLLDGAHSTARPVPFTVEQFVGYSTTFFIY